MGQLLVTLIVPPIVGMITYIVVRYIWERDENASGDGVYALNQLDGTVVFGDGIQGAVPPRGQSNVEESYEVGDGMETVHMGLQLRCRGCSRDRRSWVAANHATRTRNIKTIFVLPQLFPPSSRE